MDGRLWLGKVDHRRRGCLGGLYLALPHPYSGSALLPGCQDLSSSVLSHTYSHDELRPLRQSFLPLSCSSCFFSSSCFLFLLAFSFFLSFFSFFFFFLSFFLTDLLYLRLALSCLPPPLNVEIPSLEHHTQFTWPWGWNQGICSSRQVLYQVSYLGDCQSVVLVLCGYCLWVERFLRK